MFNTLFNSLFGKSKDNNFDNLDEDNKNSNESDLTRSLKEINSNVTAISLEDDWLFVEKEEDQEEDSTSIEKTPNNLQLVPYKNLLTHLGCIDEDEENNFLSANLPSLYPSSMDDSWFLTPPECFTSVSAIQLESSPLENLLIEHPSMSVYFNYGPNRAWIQGETIRSLKSIEFDAAIRQCSKDVVSKSHHRSKKNYKKNPPAPVPKDMALVTVSKSTKAAKSQEQRKAAPKSAFERNNKNYSLRNAPKRTTVINQPTSRTMMISNKKN